MDKCAQLQKRRKRKGREGAFFVGLSSRSIRLVQKEPPAAAAAPDVLLEEMSHAGGSTIQPRPSGSGPPRGRMSFSLDITWTVRYFSLSR